MQQGKRTRKRMTLRGKINLLVTLIVGIILTLVMTLVSFLIIHWKFEDRGDDALTVAKTVSSMPQIIAAFQQPDPSKIIQPLAEELRQKTGAEFIVVGNMDLIRYSHPNPAEIGQTMVGGDDSLVLNGQDSVTQAMGTLGMSVRGKAPIYDAAHHQIGVVSVGFSVQDIWKDIFVSLCDVIGMGLVALALGLIGAHLLSGHIKRQIFNMEPFEIAMLTQEQAAIMESIREGILAVDIEGKITAGNHEAKRLMGLAVNEEIIGKSITSVMPHSRLPEVLEDGVSHMDTPMIIGNTLTIVNRVPVLLNGTVIGAVGTFRDKIQLDQIDQRLADVGRYADALRSQRHEFMNRLHTISGLIQLEEYDLVRELINQVNDEQQRLLEFFITRVRDSAVVGLLIGKIHRAKELGIQLTVDPRSRLQEVCPHRETVITIIGNALDNAFEALAQTAIPLRQPEIVVYLNDETERLHIQVRDNGRGIDPQLGERIFEDGVTTKGPGRGFGLALSSRLVANVGGELAMISSEEGAMLEANLPFENRQSEELSEELRERRDRLEPEPDPSGGRR